MSMPHTCRCGICGGEMGWLGMPSFTGICQHDRTKPEPTLVPLGSAAFNTNDWAWMCTGCGERFQLPIATASALETVPAPPWRCGICSLLNPDDADHCRQCEYSRMVLRDGKQVPRNHQR